MHASCLLIFKGKALAVLLGGGATFVFALFTDLAKPLEDTLGNTFGCLRTQKCSDACSSELVKSPMAVIKVYHHFHIAHYHISLPLVLLLFFTILAFIPIAVLKNMTRIRIAITCELCMSQRAGTVLRLFAFLLFRVCEISWQVLVVT